jgi:SWI/SNF-related matrix-associated actin-dependent regulator 1 of chromatin subfamily A
VVSTTPLKKRLAGWKFAEEANDVLGFEAFDIEAAKVRVTEVSNVAAWDWPAHRYQIEGIDTLRRKKRYMNLDDPGLGKTAQAAFAAESPTLIICPNYLVGQWFDWLAGRDEKSREMHDGKVVKNVLGTIRRVRGNFDKKNGILEKQRTDPAEWVIINQEMAHTHVDTLMDLYFRTIIIDESHHFKNVASYRGRNVVELYELTATPIWKEVDDLFNQFRILYPDQFKNLNSFIDTFCISDDSMFGRKVLGVKKDMIPALDEMLGALSIRRTYEQAGIFLPPLLENYITIEFPPHLQKVYDGIKNDFAAQLLGEEFQVDNYAQMLNTLRQLTAYPGKFDAVKDAIAEVKGRSVVFTWYKDSAYALAKSLPKELNPIVITGDIKDTEERKRLAKNPKHKVVVCNIAALSEGVDLSDCRAVFYCEEDWTPGSKKQTTMRVQRNRNDGGRDKTPIVCYYVHVKGTIDQYVHRVSTRRQGTMRELIREAVGLE